MFLSPIDPTIAAYRGTEKALNRLIAKGYAFARRVILPAVSVERRRYHAQDAPTAGRTGKHIDVARRALAVRLADDMQNLREHIAQLREDLAEAEAIAAATITEAIEVEGVRHRRRFVASVQSSAQINVANLLSDDDLLDMLSVNAQENVRLIKSLSGDVADHIERLALSSILEGRSNAETAKELSRLEGVDRKRAKLIARDQASKINGQMNEYRQTQAGIDEYDWRVTRDGRQRDTHDANHNKRFKWSKPPSTGHPGKEINCRCRARAVVIDDPDDE